MHFLAYHFPINTPCSVHIETSQLTCFANQSTGFKNEWNTGHYLVKECSIWYVRKTFQKTNLCL